MSDENMIEEIEFEHPCTIPGTGGFHCSHADTDTACCWCGARAMSIREPSIDKTANDLFVCQDGLHAYSPNDPASPEGTDCACGETTIIGIMKAVAGRRTFFLKYLIDTQSQERKTQHAHHHHHRPEVTALSCAERWANIGYAYWCSPASAPTSKDTDFQRLHQRLVQEYGDGPKSLAEIQAVASVIAGEEWDAIPKG